MNHQTSSVPQIAYQSPSKFLHQSMTESPLVDSGLVVPVFSPGDDPIACLNKSMAFLTAVASSRTKLLGNALILNNPRNAAWLIRIKQCLAEAQKQDQILNRRATSHIPCRSKNEDLDTYYSDCDDISNAKAVLMANIFNYGSDVISEVPPAETYLNDIENQSVHAMQDFEQTPVVDVTNNEITSDSNIIPDINLEVIKQKNSHKPIDYVLNQLSEDFGKCFVPQQELSAEQAFWYHMSNPSTKSSDASPAKMEAPKELPKVSLVNESLKKLEFHLAKFEKMVKIRTTPDARTEGEWGFEHTKAIFNNEIILFLKSLKDIFNVFDKDLLNEIMEVQTVFDQMEVAVQQSSVDKQYVLLTVINSMSLNGESVNMERKINESCDKCFNLDAELLKTQNAHNDLLKSYSQLKKQCISLELSIQLNQEIFQKDESCDNQNALEIPEYFENNDLKAQLQDKDTTICKLKEIIKSMREKSKEENVNYDYCEIETKNVELENSVAKLLSKNERLCKQINHVKQVFKDQFDSIKKTRVRTKEQCDSLIDKLNLKSAENEDLKAQIQDKVFVITSLKNDLQKLKGKEIVDIAAQIPSANTILLGMFKLDLKPLAPRLLQNREAYIDYLKYTQEQVDILREIVEQAKAKQPLDNELDFALQKRLLSHPKTMSRKLGLKCSTSNCGSKPTGNKKNDRISQTPSRNMKNKVEAQPRKVNKKNRVVKPIHDVDVKHSLLHVNSELIYANCKKSMFDGLHDMCLLDFVENVNSHAKSAKKHKNKIFGNLWIMITSANIVPPKKTTSHSIETQKPELKVYSRKPKNVKNVGSSKNAKIVESKNANHSEPNNAWGSNATDIPSSFSLVMTGTVRFGNDQIARIIGYGGYQLGNVTISRVYYVKGLGHNLFSVASKTKSWLWHRRLSHLNFGTLNKIRGIPRLKFQKDHMCSSCALGKIKKSSHQPKAEDTNQEKLYLLYMNLCGPMRVASINGKRYILVIVDDYSQFTWVRFLRTKDEAPEAIIKCIKNIQVCLNATVLNVRTDNETEFVNQTLREFYENVGISHQTSVARTPQQNGVVERRNQHL
ncbi:retrovirus-related pol polyprotein from transposon TNT 1-94 [Tanacetum coccineum]